MFDDKKMCRESDNSLPLSPQKPLCQPNSDCSALSQSNSVSHDCARLGSLIERKSDCSALSQSNSVSHDCARLGSLIEGNSERGAAEGADSLRALGNRTKFCFEYNRALLESFPNAFDNDYFIKFNCPEFTSICPITGQPDFAAIYINYIADQRCVESKSLKLYLNSYRNHGGFHETCVNQIMRDLIDLLDPRYIEVLGEFLPRGGISIDPYANYGKGEKYQKMAEFRLQNHDLAFKKVDNR